MYYFQGFIQILSFQAGNFSPGNTRIFPYKSNMFIGVQIKKLITPHLKDFIDYKNKYKTEKLTDSDIY